MGSRPCIRWSCGNTKKIQIGDRVFLMRLGWRQHNTGILASGWVTVQSFEEVHWNSNSMSPSAYYIEFEPDVLLDPDANPLLNPPLTSHKFNWYPQRSGITIPNDVALRLEDIWQDHIQGIRPTQDVGIDREAVRHTFREGSKRFISTYRYERDPRARKACIHYHGAKCKVCGFDFGVTFGAMGEGFIHVHHINLISQQDEEYEIDPIKDLQPVCPNCHAMLHRRSPPYAIDELREILGQTI